jgi:hypothetical protein
MVKKYFRYYISSYGNSTYAKKNYGYRFNEEFISKRLRALEKFLNGISIHPLLRSNEIFYDFLSISKEKDFNNKKMNIIKLNHLNL